MALAPLIRLLGCSESVLIVLIGLCAGCFASLACHGGFQDNFVLPLAPPFSPKVSWYVFNLS